mmetsp:Transcript_26856/g.30692  ORF Transcript_26856/g.30692 Transcript_26856/m.30692 type:complete len:145 (+) Transcript_26856:476-910(+)
MVEVASRVGVAHNEVDNHDDLMEVTDMLMGNVVAVAEDGDVDDNNHGLEEEDVEGNNLVAAVGKVDVIARGGVWVDIHNSIWAEDVPNDDAPPFLEGEIEFLSALESILMALHSQIQNHSLMMILAKKTLSLTVKLKDLLKTIL